MLSEARLNAGFLIGRDDEIVVSQRLSLPDPLVQIQDSTGFFLKGRVTGENPGTETPRANGVLAEPAPQGALAEGGDEAASEHFPMDVGNAEAGQWNTVFGGQLAGERLNRDDDAGGKSGTCARLGIDRPIPALPVQRSVFATY